LRAGPLSNTEVIKTLNEKFVNTWVLLRELPKLIGGAKGEVVSLIAKEMKDHYTDSVDILALTPDAEVIMHQPEMALPYRNQAQAYLTVLRHSVDAFKGKRARVGNASKLDRNPISLGTELIEILHTFSTSGTDTPDYTVVEIDATPFERGVLHIEIQVGAGEATGTFELFDADVEILTNKTTDKVLSGAWSVSPGDTGHIFHNFGQGQHFKLVATGGNNRKGGLNAFLARVFVVPPFEQ